MPSPCRQPGCSLSGSHPDRLRPTSPERAHHLPGRWLRGAGLALVTSDDEPRTWAGTVQPAAGAVPAPVHALAVPTPGAEHRSAMPDTNRPYADGFLRRVTRRP